jgi:hypothetical protein
MRHRAAVRAWAEKMLDAEDEVVCVTILDDADGLAGAFVSEELRSLIDHAFLEGTISRIESLPWGVGAGFTRSQDLGLESGNSPTNTQGVFRQKRDRGCAPHEELVRSRPSVGDQTSGQRPPHSSVCETTRW